MPKNRTDVEKIREILRLCLELNYSLRDAAIALGVSKTTVGEYIAEFKRSGLSYQEITGMSDTEVIELFDKSNKSSNPLYEALSKDFEYIAKQLKRTGVTLYLLWEEYQQGIIKLNEVQRGWVNNYRMASIQNKLSELDGWLRNRLRYCIWHHWKKPERKRKNLIRLGVEGGQAYAWSRSRKGGWAIAQSPILGTTITVERLMNRGYVSMLDIYTSISPQLNEPLYTRPVRTVV
jgi:hypothetical protein